jgi:ribbon-helix-helix CopG family protein
MKVIQVPMDEKLLHAMTRRARATRLTRAALIRHACEEYLQKVEDEELDRRYVEGYRREPEKPGLGKVGAKLAAQVWSREDWS